MIKYCLLLSVSNSPCAWIHPLSYLICVNAPSRRHKWIERIISPAQVLPPQEVLPAPLEMGLAISTCNADTALDRWSRHYMVPLMSMMVFWWTDNQDQHSTWVTKQGRDDLCFMALYQQKHWSLKWKMLHFCVDLLHGQMGLTLTKTAGTQHVACSNSISGQLDWMQCKKACVEWIAKRSTPTVQLFETWQKFCGVYFKESGVVAGLFSLKVFKALEQSTQTGRDVVYY